jgi:hypothetical protein
LDRFYYPIKTTYATALSTSFNYSYKDPNLSLFLEGLSSSEYYDVPFPYNSLQEEYEVTPQNIKSAIYGRSFYDKVSDVVIRPNSEYIYYRVGNDYVKDVIKNIKGGLGSGCSYSGVDFLHDLYKESMYTRVSPLTVKESLPHGR